MVSRLPSYQRRAGGFVLPAPLGGDVALDFCNTLAGHGEDAPREYLAGFDELAVWTTEAGLLTRSECAHVRRGAEAEPRRAEQVLADAKRLRSAAYAVCTGTDGGAWSTLSRFVEAAGRRASFERPTGGGTAAWRLPQDLGLRLPLHAAALAVGDFLVAHRLQDVGRCPGRGCGWLFLDPAGRRVWCSMASCGNREKARRHARRLRSRR